MENLTYDCSQGVHNAQDSLCIIKPSQRHSSSSLIDLSSLYCRRAVIPVDASNGVSFALDDIIPPRDKEKAGMWMLGSVANDLSRIY